MHALGHKSRPDRASAHLLRTQSFVESDADFSASPVHRETPPIHGRRDSLSNTAPFAREPLEAVFLNDEAL